MPLGKYHCDYCDKDLPDTPVARKRHLHSSSHLRAKSLWYNSFPSSSSYAAAPPPPPPSPGLCNRFVQTVTSSSFLKSVFRLLLFLIPISFHRQGFCPYGHSCKYLHLTSTAAATQNYNSAQGLIAAGSSGVNPPLSSSSLPVMPNSMGGWQGNLPPSLMPPPEGGYRSDLPFLDWE
ncbi:Zinc finger CCCH domain-containing protein 3 [Linum grandiflorum]